MCPNRRFFPNRWFFPNAMCKPSLWSFCLAVFLGICSGVCRAEGVPGTPQATLPLSEVLRLYKASENQPGKGEQRPPFDATVNKFELTGRLLENALELSAHIELSVLETKGWALVSLLRKDGTLRIHRLPQMQNGLLTVVNGMLTFVTDKPGTYSFDVGFLVQAQTVGNKHRAEIVHTSAALALLRLRYDENLFALENTDRIEEGDGFILFPQNNRFLLTWNQNGKAATNRQALKRPPIEPIVSTAYASVVSTLEGRRNFRLLYVLRMEGTRVFNVRLPEKQHLEKVFLNGASIPFQVNDRVLSLSVSPSRTGDEMAKVELFVIEEQGGYALSGKLHYALATPFWNVNDLFVTLYLPQVFNYQWEGGSLASTEEATETEYTQKIPTPGKRISLHQQLLSTAASVRVAYTVDLTGNYYRK